MSTTSTTSPTKKKKKNAASQFRSGRSRISHPLLDSSVITPTRPKAKQPMVAPVTPEHPTLLSALEMAARPSPMPPNSNNIRNDGKNGSSSTSTSKSIPTKKSYSSSIEAMAAHVEASHNTKRRSSSNISNRLSSPPKLTKRISSGGSVSSSRSSLDSRKSSMSINGQQQQAGRKSLKPPLSKVWLIAIPILLSFLIFESMIWLLVFRFKDAASTTRSSVFSTQTKVNLNNNVEPIIPHQKDHVKNAEESSSVDSSTVADEEFNATILSITEMEDVPDDIVYSRGEEGIATNETKVLATSSADTTSVEHYGDDSLGGKGNTQEKEDDKSVEMNGELEKLQSMLNEGFDKLRGSSSSDHDHGEESNNRKLLVESLCGNVWVVANERVSSNKNNVDDINNVESGAAATQVDTNPWRSLALDAQHCLGGAGLAFLSKDNVDSARLRVSTKVFDRLSYVEPYEPNVRAGLGTSLLIQAIFYHEQHSDYDDTDKADDDDDDTQQSLLTLAAYHLKVASSLFSATVTSGESKTASPAAISKQTRTALNDETSASNAAILHNLALAYIALGDNTNSVPVLLRAAALRRELSGSSVDGKMYWNAPNEVLLLAEEKALLLAAKMKKPEKEKKRRIPFLR